MRSHVFWLSVTTCLCLSHAASGADLRPRPYTPGAPATYISPAPTWTGWYLGGNLGYGWGRGRTDVEMSGFSVDTGTVAGIVDMPGVASSRSNSIDGWLGGVQTGYNWQVAPAWLFGLETDFQRAGQKGSQRAGGDFDSVVATPDLGAADCPCPVTGNNSLSYETKLQWFGTARARVGFIRDSLLFYGTGGLAYGRFQVNGKSTSSLSVSDDTATEIYFDSSSDSFSKSQWKTGWTLGGGIEGQLWDPRWTWKAEYLYMDFGTLKTRAAGDTTISTKFNDHVTRLGVNYRF